MPANTRTSGPGRLRRGRGDDRARELPAGRLLGLDEDRFADLPREPDRELPVVLRDRDEEDVRVAMLNDATR
jgi:hypothetical protein